MTQFGTFVNRARRSLQADDRRYSLRQVAKRIGVEPGYLSKIERGQVAPPSEAATVRLAKELDQDPDVLLALGGKVSSDLQDVIRKRPRLFAELIRDSSRHPTTRSCTSCARSGTGTGRTHRHQRPTDLASDRQLPTQRIHEAARQGEWVGMITLEHDRLVFRFPRSIRTPAAPSSFSGRCGFRTMGWTIRCRQGWAASPCGTWTTTPGAFRRRGCDAAAC